MNNHIERLWTILENEKNYGLVKRLYSSELPLHIYATYQYPEKYYSIAFTLSDSIKIDITHFNNFNNLKISLAKNTTISSTNLLLIQLIDYNKRGIFAILCENLIHSVISLDIEKKIISNVINQLDKWKMNHKMMSVI